MIRVIIAGTRTFSDYDLLCERVDDLLAKCKDKEIEIVSGGAKGADALGERYAEEHGLPCKVFPADWDKYGKAAGPIRNKQMAEYADACIVFWDGKSRGTNNMITEVRGRQCETCIFYYDTE